MPTGLVVPEGSGVYRQLQALAAAGRWVFFAGLPGTGKSLLIHQLSHLAAAAGRTVHLLQWDTARPAFEASPAGVRYPVRDGVTHEAIRKAVGLWVRRALLQWEAGHPDSGHLLVGETPLVGHRFVELARVQDDATEPLLSAATTRFVVPVPSREVRRFLEAERGRRAARPLHPREREDAPPRVLHDLWRHLAGVAAALGVAAAAPAGPYDPDLYRRVYERLLRHRRVEVVPVDARFPTETLSVYDFAIARRDVLPTPGEGVAAIGEVERRYPDPETLRREIERWYLV
ncbi:MAG: hypothetical protein ACREMB_00290 [Candidatus Rokuibacteriota bacterium]